MKDFTKAMLLGLGILAGIALAVVSATWGLRGLTAWNWPVWQSLLVGAYGFIFLGGLALVDLGLVIYLIGSSGCSR